MKTKGVPGDFAFRALFRYHAQEWHLSEEYFFSKPVYPGKDVLWPVEIDSLTGAVYVPSEEELKDE